MVARITADAVNGEILDSELARDRTRSLEHTPLEGEPRDIQTILVIQVSKVRSPSTILQDSVRRGGVCVDMESTVTRIPVTIEQKRFVNGPYWNLNCLNPCPLAVSCLPRVFWSIEKLQCFKHAL